MEKSLLTTYWACKLGRKESQGISRAGQTLLERLMESHICHPPALWLCGRRVQKRYNGLCLPFCLGKSCPPAPTLMPDMSVLYATGAFQAATPVLELRRSDSEYVRVL